VHQGQGAGELDTADGDRDDGGDLDNEQPSTGSHVLVEDRHPVGGADQRIAEGERRLDGD
jgi:hypothetical protein